MDLTLEADRVSGLRLLWLCVAESEISIRLNGAHMSGNAGT